MSSNLAGRAIFYKFMIVFTRPLTIGSLLKHRLPVVFYMHRVRGSSQVTVQKPDLLTGSKKWNFIRPYLSVLVEI